MNEGLLACSLPSAGDRNNIIFRVPRLNHKEQDKFKENAIKIKKKKILVKMKNNFCLVNVNKNNSDN